LINLLDFLSFDVGEKRGKIIYMSLNKLEQGEGECSKEEKGNNRGNKE